MKDYSKYFKNQETFITSYRIKDNKIFVKFVGLKQEQVYELTKENIEKFDKRMEEQYKKAIENIDIVSGSKKFSYLALSLLLTVITLIFSSFFLALTQILPLLMTFIFILSTISLTIELTLTVINSIKFNKINSELSLCKDYIENKKELEKASKKEENITKNVNKNPIMQEQKMLVQKDLIKTEFNINLMDNISLKELKELSTQLKIYQGLQQPVEFKEVRKETIFTRKKVKEKQQ